MATPEELERIERIRRKYRALLSDLYKIRNKMSKLSTNYQSFVSLLDDSVQIDEKMFENDEIINIKKELDSIKNDLNGNLIQRVSSKT